MLRVGVIGYGYWGPNIVRNFHGLENSRVEMICDTDPNALRRASNSFPGITLTADPSEVTRSSHIDVVAIVTPVSQHYDLARSALQHGKHVFLEKPFTAKANQALELIELAERKHLQIAVDHTFLFTGAVRKIRQLIDDGVLGKLFYYDSMRVNLGLLQRDVNVIWDLAPHDFAVMSYVIQAQPEALIATGQSHVNGHEDVAFITLYFPDKMIAHINVNWLSPVKIRTTLIGGEKKMLVWNDIASDEKLKVYDKGVDVETQEGVYELLVNYRSGDMWAPRLDQTEALKSELTHFVDCVHLDKKPINDGVAGLRVVQLLEATEKSIKQRGALVTL